MTLRYLAANAQTSAGNPFFSTKLNRADSIKLAGMDIEMLTGGQDIHIFYSSIAGCYYSGVVLKHENLVSFVISKAGQAEFYYYGAIPDDIHHNVINVRPTFIEGPSAESATYSNCSTPKRQNEWSNSLAEVESLIDSIEHGAIIHRSSSIMDLAARVSEQPFQGIVDVEAWATGLAQDIVNADD